MGPRLISNQTSQPLSIHGERFVQGMRLRFGPPVDRELDVSVHDAQHAFARLPPVSLTGQNVEVPVTVTLVAPGAQGSAVVTLVNDSDFPDLWSLVLSRDGGRAFAASVTTDELFAVELASGKVERYATGDGPSALAWWTDPSGRDWLVVAHQFSPPMLLSADGRETVELPGPSYAFGLLVHDGIAYFAEHARDSVTAVRLSDRQVLWQATVGPNPRAMAVGEGALFVGSLQTGELERLNLATGRVLGRTAPGPGTRIIGGGTAAYSDYVMGGKAVRALAYSAKAKALFLSSIGPNIGPNPDRMEVSMNGGVAAVDGEGRWLRHLGFGAGVTEGLALDESRGLLYAADGALGLLRVLDASKLVRSDEQAASALIQEVAVPPPEGFPLARKPEDYGGARAGVSMHSGTRLLALSPDGRTLHALNRFTGTLAVIDVSLAAKSKASLTRQIKIVDTTRQATRRLGQVLYFADMGRTAMSCDACHPEGHTEGVLFEKTHPLRIYRSTTVRGSRETPPYFTPASTHSMAETMRVVGGRNRFHNPDPSAQEINALSVYGSTIALLPNPFRGPDGALLDSLDLPDGRKGDPRAGLKLFEGKAGCIECHPPPLYTLDQDAATRGRYLDVGTPHALMLRPHQQNLTFEGMGVPSLLGVWDVWPMLSSGAAGFAVEGERLVVETRFALRAAIEAWAPKHGRADLLTESERDDLVAFVQSL